jgi:hypothetical protein
MLALKPFKSQYIKTKMPKKLSEWNKFVKKNKAVLSLYPKGVGFHVLAQEYDANKAAKDMIMLEGAGRRRYRIRR